MAEPRGTVNKKYIFKKINTYGPFKGYNIFTGGMK
jgi:hypothetical protein